MHTRNKMYSNRGFTLVEVLVSLVVLSVGLLGMAKLVLVTAHANDSAYLRSQATALAYEMVDHMRANPDAAIKHEYDTVLNAMPLAPVSCVGIGAGCGSLQVALFDVYSWKQHLDAATVCGGGGVTCGALPSGTGSVVTSTSIPVTATIVVQWDDAAAQSVFRAAAVGAAAPMSITLQTVLQ